MLKHKTKFTSLLLAAGTILSGTTVSFAEKATAVDAENATAVSSDTTASSDEKASPVSADVTETFSTPLYTSGLYSTDEQSEGVTVTHDIMLDYDNNLVKDNYLIQNESDTDVSFDILIPQITSLAVEPEELYSFDALVLDKDSFYSLPFSLRSRDYPQADFEESEYYSPLFSANGLSETSLSLEELYQGQFYNTDIPTDTGVLYHLSRPLTDSNLDAKACMSISGLSDNCHIYPLGCSYTTTDDGYELSISKNFNDCYVFLTGTESTDFTVSLIEPEDAKTDAEKFSMDDESSDLQAYLEFCCDWYLEQNKDNTQATPELLLSNLADYFGRSSVTVSIDLLPTIDWLTQQKRFLVHQYTVTVPADSYVFAWIDRETELSKKEVTFNVQLARNTVLYAHISNTATICLPDGYSSAIVRNTDSSKLSTVKTDDDKEIVTYSIKSFKGDTYSVALFRTPIWNATLKYLPIFIVIMAVFMLLCLISYLSRRKKR